MVKLKQHITNFSFIGLSTIFSAILVFAVGILMAQKLGPNEYGNVTSFLSLVAAASTISGFGIEQGLLQIFGRGSKQGNEIGCAAVVYGLVTLVLSISIVLVMLMASRRLNIYDFAYAAIALLVSTFCLNLRSAILQIESNYRMLSIWQMSQNLMRFGILVIFYHVLSLSGIHNTLIVYAVVAIAITLWSIRDIARLCNGRVGKDVNGPSRNSIRIPDFKNAFELSWPFGAMALCHAIYFQINVFMLGEFSNARDAGIYSVAFNFIMAIYLIPAVIYQKMLLPKIHVWSNVNLQRMKYIFQLGNGLMTITGLIAAVALYFLAPYLISSFYGEDYESAIAVLRLLCLSVPVRFIISGLGAFMSIDGNVIPKLKAMSIVAVSYVILNLPLVHLFGVTGAAFGMLISELMLCSFFLHHLRAVNFRSSSFMSWFNFTENFRNVSKC